jgi:hypothetical protein
MGILNSGILGHLSGKTAGVVGGKWKNKSYIREYVIPANPNTTPQQVQRAKFRVGVAFLKALVGQVLNVYVDKFQKSMSGFNYILGTNMAYWISPITYASVKIVFGKLWGPASLSVGSASHNVAITWNPTSYGNNGAATDMVYACAYSTTTGLWYFATAAVARSVNHITVPVGAAEDGNTVHAYCWAAKYSATSPTLLEMVSDSGYGNAVIAA